LNVFVVQAAFFMNYVGKFFVVAIRLLLRN